MAAAHARHHVATWEKTNAHVKQKLNKDGQSHKLDFRVTMGTQLLLEFLSKSSINDSRVTVPPKMCGVPTQLQGVAGSVCELSVLAHVCDSKPKLRMKIGATLQGLGLRGPKIRNVNPKKTTLCNLTCC